MIGIEEADVDSRLRARRREPCALYLISPLETGEGFARQLGEALAAGLVAAFQFRVKGMDEHRAARLAEPLQLLCADHDTAFLVNDSIALAKRLGADGVHLGQGDGDPREARNLLGPDAQIGVTAHASRHLAMEAGDAGADYVAFGSFYPSATKPSLHRPDPSILRWWSALFELPCVAIGGIDAGNLRPLVEAGADLIAVSGAVWGHSAGPGAAVSELLAALADQERNAGETS